MESFLIRHRRLFILASHVVLIVFAYYASFLLRFDGRIPNEYFQTFLKTLPLLLAIRVLALAYFDLFRGLWRYVSVEDLLGIIKAATAGSVLFVIAIVFAHGLKGFPRSVFVADWLLNIMLTGGIRFALRLVRQRVAPLNTEPGRRVLIIGAGDAGEAVLREIKSHPRLNYQPIGFLDTDKAKHGLTIHGAPVLGGDELLPNVISDNQVEEVIIALRSRHRKDIRRIVELCADTGARFKTVPSIDELIGGVVQTKAIREVQLDDLLGRDPVAADPETMRKDFEAQVIMVTGAGGSIGSELCRQLASLSPAKLVLYERNENNLFQADLMLAQDFPYVPRAAIIGDIRDEQKLDAVLSAHHPHYVFHAAAYKHVPLMESNLIEAVENNVIGTQRLAQAAARHGVGKFILISTDKAVRPRSVMGVTKRCAELVVSGMNGSSTRFVAVRFGNVLGSTGSVVPIFKQQIARGGPVTVTHPEATRYFMSIPEATQLVMQAAVLGQGGELFLLDMGEPVKIVDLARSLIDLSGFVPDEDIEIKFTGLRPGEKLTEELLIAHEQLADTSHPKIKMVRPSGPGNSPPDLEFAELAQLTHQRDEKGVLRKLKEIVPEFETASA